MLTLFLPAIAILNWVAVADHFIGDVLRGQAEHTAFHPCRHLFSTPEIFVSGLDVRVASPVIHQQPAAFPPENGRFAHQMGCDLVIVESNTAQGNKHNTLSLNP